MLLPVVNIFTNGMLPFSSSSFLTFAAFTEEVVWLLVQPYKLGHFASCVNCEVDMACRTHGTEDSCTQN
jgi:hypothetical protein